MGTCDSSFVGESVLLLPPLELVLAVLVGVGEADALELFHWFGASVWVGWSKMLVAACAGALEGCSDGA